MADLSQALNVDPLKFQDKAVKSIRSRVTNSSGHLKEPMDVMNFANLINDHIISMYPEARPYDLSDEDHQKINALVRSKYNTWEWNFGYSPNYNFKKILRTEKSGTIEFDLDVKNGSIIHIKIFGDYFSKFDTEEIEGALMGVSHEESAIRKALEKFNLGDYFANLEMEEFLTGIF